MVNNHKSCLVLNADYSPMGIIDWQKAIIWSYRYIYGKTNQIEILEYYTDDYVSGVNGKIELPAIIKTTRYFKLNSSHVNFSRKNLFIRDNYTCQYCGVQYPIAQLTYDHVIPKSKWKEERSPTCWTNIVTACKKCNINKGNRTPVQANMPLKSQPYIPRKSPKYLPVYNHLSIIGRHIPDTWRTYIN